MNTEEFKKRVRSFLVVRLVFTTILLGSILYFRLHIKQFHTGSPLIAGILVLYLIPLGFSVFYGRWKISPRNLKRLSYLQFLLDSVLVIGLILITGGIESWFSFLLILITMSASVVLGKRAGYIFATLNGILYGTILDLQYYGIIPIGYNPEFNERAFFYNIFINIFGLYLTAYLMSYLVTRLEKTSATLEKRDTDLRELSRFHSEVIENIPSGLFTTDSEGYITLFNPAAERITGLKREAVLSRKITDIFPFLNMPPRMGRTEGRIRADGEERFIGMNISINRDTLGETVGFIGTFQDLTDIVKMEEEIKRKEKLAAIGELSASIAHELRNPLASIKSSFEMLKEGRLDNESKIRLMEIALTEMDRLNAIVTDFLLYSNPRPPVFTEFNLSRIVEEVIAMAENLKDGVEVMMQSPEKIMMTGDEQRIRQLLWNLTVNAIEAINGEGKVLIGVEKTTEGIIISIRDTGRGIPEEIRPKIFYPFFSTRKGGTGLGLAIAYRIVEEHNGNIKVESEIGKGTEFRIIFPTRNITEQK